jgi:TRAP-type C4-dicarboxylate transport system permease small subunit
VTVLETLLGGIRAGVRWVSLALLALLIVTPLAQILVRGVFNAPMASAEELARYFLICLTFLASSYVTLEGGQIRMEEFQGALPARLRWYLQMTIELSGVAMFGVIFAAAVITIAANLDNQTPTLEMPFWLFMAPLLVGSLLLMIETTMLFLHTLRRRRPEDKHTVLT